MSRRHPVRRLNLLGSRVRVKSSFNRSLEAISGRVVDETKNMFLIALRDDKIVKAPKSACVLEVEAGGKTYLIDGSSLIGRLERRLSEK